MSVSTELGPFQPGTGRPPPYLAGREEEQSLFRSHFEALRRGRSAPAEILLHGPRGNGKTGLVEPGADDEAGQVVRRGVPAGEFEAERDDYDLDRFRELEKRNLLPAARAVAAAFREETLLSHTAFHRAIAQGGGPAGAGAAKALDRLGLVWHTRGTPSREPGIPGLLDYLVREAPAP